MGDFGFEYANFYRNNLGVPVNGSAMFSEGAVGAAQGAGTAFSDAGRAAWSLLSSPVQGSEQIVNGLMSLSKHPGDAMMDSVEASQTKQAMAYIYNLQGNYAASAAITTQSDVEFALSMIPANRASTLAELSSLGRQIDDLSLSGLASGETKAVGNRGAAANDDFFAANPVDEAAGLEGKGKALSEGSTAEQPALPSYYREDSSGGAMLAKTAGLPEGYRRVFNLRTGNVEVVSPEGVFYFDTPDGGLKPKAGGNLAQLVKAEGEIAGAKATGQIVPDVISPTYRELQGLNKGFQAHHTLPQYLGKMLGYTKNDMLDHPATLITQYSHTGKVNPDAMHKAISKYLPPMVGGKPTTYTLGQISSGLQKAYGDIGRPNCLTQSRT